MANDTKKDDVSSITKAVALLLLYAGKKVNKESKARQLIQLLKTLEEDKD